MGFIAGSQVWFALLIVRALMGALSAPLHPGAARAVASWFGRDSQSSANGLITGASIFAYAVVHPVFGKLIESIDWPHAFLITGGLTAMLAILWYVMAVEPRSNISAPQPQSNPSAPSVPLSPASEEPANRQRRQKSLALLTLSYAAVGYFQYLFFYWLHYYFDSVLHMDKEQSRFYAGLPNLAMAIGMPIGGWFTGWVERNWGQKHRVWVPGIGMFLSSLCLAGGITSHAPGWIVGWFTASLGILGVCEAAFWTTAVGLGGQKGGGTSAAIMNTGGNAIGLLAPMVTPLVSQRLGWTWGIGFGGLIGILGALCWLGIQPEKETSHERIS